MSYALNEYQPTETVLKNRQRLARSVCGRDFPVAILRQVHSDRVLKASQAFLSDPPQGDGWVTGELGLLISVQTADCLPVLLADPQQRVVAAVHAGWRGVLQRIAFKTAHQMQTDFGSRPGDCLAVVGPAIRRCCYEVGEEVVEVFTNEFERSASFFLQAPSDKTTRANSRCLDLAGACKSQLMEAGLAADKIFTDGPCTACERDRFFSHRADGGKAGRMMAVIGVLDRG